MVQRQGRSTRATRSIRLGYRPPVQAGHGARRPDRCCDRGGRVEEERWHFDNDLYAERAARVRLLVESGMSTFDAVALAQLPPDLNPDTIALLERAEAYLASGDGESAA